MQLAIRGARELPEYAGDQINLKRILGRRREQEQVYFNQVAGRFDRVYGPGRSWQAFGHLLLRILPPLVVADLGSGEGLLSELLARRCRKVIAVDNSEKIVAFGAAKARKNNLKNLEFRLGDLQNPPVEPESVDLAILSQALHHAEDPAKAIASAYRILKPGGQVMILDLAKHRFAQGAGTLRRPLAGLCGKRPAPSGWKRRDSRRSRSASSPAKSSRRISRPCWPARRSRPALGSCFLREPQPTRSSREITEAADIRFGLRFPLDCTPWRATPNLQCNGERLCSTDARK